MKMSRNNKYDYKKAEKDLYNVENGRPYDVYDSRSEASFRKYMKEKGLNPDRYVKPEYRNNSNNSNNNSGGCYLTTACVEAKGLPDDCAELQTLRAFRDSYLSNLPNGKEEIDRYYRMAPGIVNAINMRDDHQGIWNLVYSGLVAPCVKLICEGENEVAYQHYKACSIKLYEHFFKHIG